MQNNSKEFMFMSYRDQYWLYNVLVNCVFFRLSVKKIVVYSWINMLF